MASSFNGLNLSAEAFCNLVNFLIPRGTYSGAQALDRVKQLGGLQPSGKKYYLVSESSAWAYLKATYGDRLKLKRITGMSELVDAAQSFLDKDPLRID